MPTIQDGIVTDEYVRSTTRRFPPGFFVLFFVLMLTSACFALVQGLLVLYCTSHFDFSDSRAYLLFGAFASLVFAIPLLAGYISGRFLGYPLAITMGLSIATAGLYTICLGTMTFFYIGLGTFMVGISTSVTSVYILLGRVFKKNDIRRDSGFTFCYAGMNIGALVALLASGFLVTGWGYQSAFLISAVVMLIALLIFILNIRTFLHPDIEFSDLVNNAKSHQMYRPILGAAIIIAIIPLCSRLLYYSQYSDKVLFVMGIVAACIMLLLGWIVNAKQRKHFLVFIILMLLGIGFWSFYMLTPSMLTIFVLRNVDRHILNFTVPPSEFISLNPFFIIILGFLFSWLWLRLSHKGKSPSLPTKFALGITFMGCAYLLLALSTKFPNSAGLIPTMWLIGSYALQSAGELCISPIGIAMIGKLIPREYQGISMGTWLLSIGIGSTLSGYLAATTTNPKHIVDPHITNPIYGYSFLHFGLLALSVAVIALLLTPILKRMLDSA